MERVVAQGLAKQCVDYLRDRAFVVDASLLQRSAADVFSCQGDEFAREAVEFASRLNLALVATDVPTHDKRQLIKMEQHLQRVKWSHNILFEKDPERILFY